MQALSASGIKEYLECKLKAYYRYNKNAPRLVFDEGPANIGRAVHAAIEELTKRMVGRHEAPSDDDRKFAHQVYLNEAIEAGLDGLDSFKEGQEILDKFIDEYDHTEEVIAAEHQFDLVTPEGVPIRGCIDKIIKVDENTLLIVDYKTSRIAQSTSDLLTDIQLSMYDLAASLLWPQYSEIRLALHYVRLGRMVTSYRTEQDRLEFREFLVSVWNSMRETLNGDLPQGTINRYCGTCNFKEQCSVYSEAMTSGDFTLTPLPEMDDEALLEHWEYIHNLDSIISARKRELKDFLIRKLHEGHEFASENYNIQVVQRGRTSYPANKLLDYIPPDRFADMVRVNVSKLKQYLKENPELSETIEPLAEVSFDSPSLKVVSNKES